MKFKIHNSKYNDCLFIEGDSIEGIRIVVKLETSQRGWKDEDCWSEQVKEVD